MPLPVSDPRNCAYPGGGGTLLQNIWGGGEVPAPPKLAAGRLRSPAGALERPSEKAVAPNKRVESGDLESTRENCRDAWMRLLAAAMVPPPKAITMGCDRAMRQLT